MTDTNQEQSICPLCMKPGTCSPRAEKMLGLAESDPARHIFRCQSCDFYWLSPRLSEQEKTELYTETYFEDENREYSYEVQVKDCEQCFTETARNLAQHIPPNGKILDVGCANGRFLEICKSFGLAVTGVEFSVTAAAEASQKGLEVITGDIEHPALNDRTFDAIHMSHVLEHLDAPRQTIRRLHELLVPGGLIYIEVPRQLDSWLERVNEARKKYYAYGPFSLHHSVFFSPASLASLLTSEGFEIEKIQTARSCKRASRNGMSAFFVKAFIALSDIFKKGDLVCVYARRKQ